ncbi:hypothetical protein ABS768_05560 [Flavobacterium sp. ST-75]|uniref:GLPGLI family protein n=1 Tax=Flavobacterium rhizophilum TaxID=3163296 RepID=A0ABW8YCC0_9FLAO
MKQFTLALVLLFSVLAIAQEEKKPEIFPFKRPELLVGKTVTIRPLTDEEIKTQKGYHNFYKDKYHRHSYHEIGFETSDPKSLENRVFKVVSTHPKYNNKLTLEAEDGEIIYHDLLENYPEHYYFEVEGGLDVPNDFYCDYFDRGVDDGKKGINKWAGFYNITVRLDTGFITQQELAVGLSFEMDSPADFGLTIIFDNGEKIELPQKPLVYSEKDGKKHTHLELAKESDKKLFSEHRITTVIFGKEKSQWGSDFTPQEGERVRGIIKCGLDTIEERMAQN